MSKTLDVYFHEKVIGKLEQDNHGEINFTYSTSWLEDPQAIQISRSLPLQKETFNRKQCRAFFEGILPEEGQRRLIARNLGISANNDFSMLEKIGGECAGALSFIQVGNALELESHSYHEIADDQLADILRELPKRPLLAGERGVRLSLAGVQDKLAVFYDENKISIPINNAPSTHILKPDFSDYEGVIFNEAFCMQLAKDINLSVADVVLKKIEDIDYLLIKRYDRSSLLSSQISSNLQRIHQEDFCQALGIPPTKKYQNEGGPSLKQCFNLLREISSVPVIDLRKLMDAVIFNFIIGNCDAHGKNFSLLYSDQIQMAPLYDLICTYYYDELDKKMAMKLGGEYSINNISLENFNILGNEVGFAKPEIRRRIIEICDDILSALPLIEKQHTIQEKVADVIKLRCLDFSIGVRRK